MNKSSLIKVLAILLGTSAVATAQSPYQTLNTPYTNVVPLGNGPAYPNRTNLNVNYWSTNTGWFDVSAYPDLATSTPGLSIVDTISNGGAAPNGQQWSTTDPGNNPGVLQVNEFTFTNGNAQDPAVGGQSFNLGGEVALSPYNYLPATNNVSYYNTFNRQYNDANAVWTFAEFVIGGPSSTIDGTLTNQDAFGFSLWSEAPGVGNALAEFKFSSQYLTGTNTNNANLLGFAWFLNGIQQNTNNSALTGNWAIQYNSVNRLNVSVQTNNTLSVSLDSLNTNGAFIYNLALITNGAIGNGLGWNDYNTVSIDWALASGDPSLPGANFMTVNTLEVVATTVPEPGTWAVGALLLGGIAARVYRRRQAAAAKA